MKITRIERGGIDGDEKKRDEMIRCFLGIWGGIRSDRRTVQSCCGSSDWGTCVFFIRTSVNVIPMQNI